MRAWKSTLSRLALWQTLGGVALATTLLLTLAWQSPSPITIEVGGPTDELYVKDFHEREISPQGPFRWTMRRSSLFFPGVGTGDWQLRLALGATRAPGVAAPTVDLIERSTEKAFASLTPTSHLLQPYYIKGNAPVTASGDVALIISTNPVYSAAGDSRELGVTIQQATLTPKGFILPSLLHLVALVGSVLSLSLALYMIGGGAPAVTGGLVAAAAVASLVAWQRLAVTPFVSYMLLVAALLAVGIAFARAILTSYVPGAGGIDAIAARSGQLALAVLLIVAISYGLVTLGVALVEVFNHRDATDFQAMWGAADRLNQGQQLYDVEGVRANPFAAFYKYPPLFSGLIRPLALTDYDTARTWWRCLNLALAVASVGLMINSFTQRPFVSGFMPLERRTAMIMAAPATLALVFVVLVFRPLIDTLVYGQLDIIILLLLTLTLVALRTGRVALAGPPLALAVALKLFPALLLIYLAWRREWRALGSFFLFLAGWLIVGLALTGPDAWRTYMSEVLPASSGSTAWLENQTVSGFVARLLTDELALEAFHPEAGGALPMTLLTFASAAIVLAITLWAGREAAARDSAGYALGFSAFVAASIFILPAAWLHYLTMLLLPLGVVFYSLDQEGYSWSIYGTRRLMLGMALVGVGALLLAYETFWLVYTKTNFGGVWKLILSYKLYGQLALWAGMLILLRLALSRASVRVAKPPQLDSKSSLVDRQNPGPIAGFAAIFCALAALYQLYLGLQSGGVPPEFALFGVLTLIFAALWWASRRLNML